MSFRNSIHDIRKSYICNIKIIGGENLGYKIHCISEDRACLAAEGRGGRVMHDIIDHIQAALQRVALAQCAFIQLRQAIRRAPRWPHAGGP